jgi:hypothetical protein
MSSNTRVAPWTVWPPEGLPTWKQGAGTSVDATPLVGPLASPAASGAAGQGASGNPLTPAASSSTNLSPDNPWAFDPDPYMSPGGGKAPWNPGHSLPGQGLPDFSPVGAPAAGLDTSPIADNRLAGLWASYGLSGSTEYYGVKPGNQTGRPEWDDTRNQRAPLPGGGRTTLPAVLPAIPPPQPAIPWPPSLLGFGGPMVPNPQTQDTTDDEYMLRQRARSSAKAGCKRRLTKSTMLSEGSRRHAAGRWTTRWGSWPALQPSP